MREIPEQQIAAMAPNANAINNARKIVKSGGFTEHARSEDDTFYMGSCKGSGSSAYRVTLDFADNDAPVCRCSCPSRQFPCKHGLALMMELSQGRHWDICDIPQDILDKRAKKDVRAGKKESQGDRPRAPKKTNQAARTKKLKKQLEGLDLAEKVVRELVEAGLGTLNGTSVKVYQDLAKQLGDYYLPGPQRLVQSLVLEVSRLKEDGKGDYKESVRILVFLRALIKKSRAYLTEKLEQGQVEDDASVLYEELGGIWRLDQLEELGLKKENAQLLQLSFSVLYDEAAREYIDEAFWADIDTGEVSVSRNYRPVRALSHIKQEDSCFAKLKVPSLIYYPGDMNRRIRWEQAIFQEVEDSDRRGLMELAWKDIPSAVKQVKNQIKNTLSDDFCGMLIAFSQIGRAGEDGECVVMEDAAGGRIELRDRTCRGWEPCVQQLGLLPDRTLLKNQVMFGLLYYDETDRKICLHPRSIVTEKEIVRLMY